MARILVGSYWRTEGSFYEYGDELMEFVVQLSPFERVSCSEVCIAVL
jgi:hypothetical protein